MNVFDRLIHVSLITRYYIAHIRECGLVGPGFLSVWRQRLFPPCTQQNEELVWFHVAGLGDATQGLAFCQQLFERFSEARVHVTYGTRGARDAVIRDYAKYGNVVGHSWLPFDLGPPMRRLVRRLKPAVVVLAQGEFWPAMLVSLELAHIPVLAIRVDMFVWEDQKEFPQWIRGFYERLLGRVNQFSVRLPEDRSNLVALGVSETRVNLGGDYRCEVFPTVRTPANANEFTCAAVDRTTIVWCGPRFDELESNLPAVLRAVNEINGRLVIAPADSDSLRSIIRYLDRMNLEFKLRSRQVPENNGCITVLDTKGELLEFYSFANLVILGDTFPPRFGIGRNFWEALSQGAAVLAGPDIPQGLVPSTLLKNGWLYVSDGVDLSDDVKRMCAMKWSRSEIFVGARSLCAEMGSAADVDLDILAGLFEKARAKERATKP